MSVQSRGPPHVGTHRRHRRIMIVRMTPTSERHSWPGHRCGAPANAEADIDADAEVVLVDG